MEYESMDTGILRRLPLYVGFLQRLPENILTVEPNQIAEDLLLDQQLVRQDMKTLMGKDRVSKENRNEFLTAIEKLTEIRNVRGVVLVGVGKLGSALMSYAGFSVYDLDILAGFDINPKIIKKGVYGKPVYPIDMLGEVCRRLKARIGVITTPGGGAQAVCDSMVKCGITSIWNFSSVRLSAPSHVMIYNEDMSAALRKLADHASAVK